MKFVIISVKHLTFTIVCSVISSLLCQEFDAKAPVAKKVPNFISRTSPSSTINTPLPFSIVINSLPFVTKHVEDHNKTTLSYKHSLFHKAYSSNQNNTDLLSTASSATSSTHLSTQKNDNISIYSSNSTDLLGVQFYSQQSATSISSTTPKQLVSQNLNIDNIQYRKSLYKKYIVIRGTSPETFRENVIHNYQSLKVSVPSILKSNKLTYTQTPASFPASTIDTFLNSSLEQKPTSEPFPEVLPTPLPLSGRKFQQTYSHQPTLANPTVSSTHFTNPTLHASDMNLNAKWVYSAYNAPRRLPLSRSVSSSSRYLSSSFVPSTPATTFDPDTPTNISAQLGTSVYIPCKIRNLGNKTVSWIRNRDSHILTVGRYIFIADARFDAWHKEETDTWILLIKFIQEGDGGSYECQVSTEPKMSHFVHFNVVSPLVRIPGGSDIHVKVGSTVSIKCKISAALQQPQYIFWYKGSERVVTSRRDGPKIFLERISNDTTVGSLVIPHASPSDAGLYQCVPAKLKTAQVSLHVINGEHPAAMQHGTSVMISPGSPGLLLLSLIVLTIIMKNLAHATFSS